MFKVRMSGKTFVLLASVTQYSLSFIISLVKKRVSDGFFSLVQNLLEETETFVILAKLNNDNFVSTEKKHCPCANLPVQQHGYLYYITFITIKFTNSLL